MKAEPKVRRRGHPTCATCKLPTSVRAEVARLARLGESPSAISRYVVDQGHGIGRDGIGRHVRQCLSVDEPDGSDPLSRSVLTARTVGWVLRDWPSKLDSIASGLIENGLSTEADAVLAANPDHMRKALAAVAGTPAEELLAARALGLACARVLGASHPEAARDLAQALADQGADRLAADLLHLADKATTNRRSEVEATSSPGSGMPPTVVNQEGSA